MVKYTKKQQEELKQNIYTYKVTKDRIFFTKEFKQSFWIKYQAGNAPRKIMKELGYELKYFTQGQIDNIVQHLRKKIISGEIFQEGCNRERRPKIKPPSVDNSPQTIQQMQHEITYLRQEVEFLKKVLQPENPP